MEGEVEIEGNFDDSLDETVILGTLVSLFRYPTGSGSDVVARLTTDGSYMILRWLPFNSKPLRPNMEERKNTLKSCSKYPSQAAARRESTGAGHQITHTSNSSGREDRDEWYAALNRAQV